MKTPETYEEFMAWMQGRYRVNECGCWVWRGAVTGARLPNASINGKTVNVRRRLVELTRKAALGRLLVVGGADCCDTCVNPEHSRVMTMSALRKMVRLHTDDVRRHCVQFIAKRRERSPIGWTEVREFRRLASEGYGPAQIKRMTEASVSRECIRLIAAGVTWREAANGSSAFEWRPAA